MKLSTQLYVLGRLGRWIATVGAVIAILGLLALTNSDWSEAARALMALGGCTIAFGIGFHFMTGDEEPIPPHVAKLMDEIDTRAKHVAKVMDEIDARAKRRSN